MAKYELTSRGEDIRIFYFKDVNTLEVTKTRLSEDFPREEYTVFVNLLQKLPFMFDGDSFYLDVEDIDANSAQLEKLAELTEGLDDKNPEDKLKIRAIMDEHYVQYIKREKVVIEGVDLVTMVKEFIKNSL